MLSTKRSNLGKDNLERFYDPCISPEDADRILTRSYDCRIGRYLTRGPLHALEATLKTLEEKASDSKLSLVVVKESAQNAVALRRVIHLRSCLGS